MSSGKLTSDSKNQFSFKRYFVNNADSYHGEFIVNELAKIVENYEASTRATSETVVGEDAFIPPPPPPSLPYEIVGTVSDPKIEKLDQVTRIIPRNESLIRMLASGYVVLDISCDREEMKLALDYLKLLKELLERQAPALSTTDVDEPASVSGGAGDSKKRYLILISTVMTWAMTKPLDPDSPDMPFIESDFRKRKPHPNYKMHYDIENEVIGLARKYRAHIGAVVVATGVTYGGKEDVLYYWFQKAWECEPTLPILGRGNNVVPLINVLDLAHIIFNLVSDFPKKLYLLAVEQNVTKQREIIKPLGRVVGSGLFKCIPAEDGFLIPEIDQRIFDLMTLNLNLEPTFIVETMGLQWTSELTIGENVQTLIKQFKKTRGLRPFKVLVYGPPLVGKTTLSKNICENYGLIYISAETIVEDTINDLAMRVAHWDGGETAALPATEADAEDPPPADDDEEEPADEEAQESARTTLAMLQSGKYVSEEEIMRFVRQKLLSHEANNRGWVMDGLPANLAQCSALFEKGEEQDGEAEDEDREEPFEEDVTLYDSVLKKILPDIVVSLEATDEFICDKAMRQPEGDRRFEEETVVKRLKSFRFGDSRDLTPLNFFDELDIHPLVVSVNDPTDYSMNRPYHEVSLRMGRACPYGKLNAMIEAADKKEKKEIETLRTKEARAQAELLKQQRQERDEKMEYWSELYSLLREEEEQALAAAGEPMRNYLVHHIFPTLTPALLEVAKLRPEDPVDFLAEYLFKMNPSGKMLEPGYNLKAEKLLGKIKILDDAIKDLDINIEPFLPPEANVGEPAPKSPRNNCPQIIE